MTYQAYNSLKHESMLGVIIESNKNYTLVDNSKERRILHYNISYNLVSSQTKKKYCLTI